MPVVNQPKKEDLTCIGFKPGVGMLYVDKKGNRFVERRRISVEENARRNKGTFRDAESHKIHMSKKERRRMKAQYEEYMRTRPKEAENGDEKEN